MATSLTYHSQLTNSPMEHDDHIMVFNPNADRNSLRQRVIRHLKKDYMHGIKPPKHQSQVNGVYCVFEDMDQVLRCVGIVVEGW